MAEIADEFGAPLEHMTRATRPNPQPVAQHTPLSKQDRMRTDEEQALDVPRQLDAVPPAMPNRRELKAAKAISASNQSRPSNAIDSAHAVHLEPDDFCDEIETASLADFIPDEFDSEYFSVQMENVIRLPLKSRRNKEMQRPERVQRAPTCPASRAESFRSPAWREPPAPRRKTPRRCGLVRHRSAACGVPRWLRRRRRAPRQ